MFRRRDLWVAAAWVIGSLVLSRSAAAENTAPSCASADTAEVARFAQLARATRRLLRGDAGRLWGARLDTVQWLGVAREEGALCAFATADPRMPAYAHGDARGDVWAGVLAPGLPPANTSVQWAGRRWAMILLPLPADSIDAVRLLTHEAMHTLQDTAGGVLPRPRYEEGSAGAALLDRPEGRVPLRLELRALSTALVARGSARRQAARAALGFRERRYAAASEDERVRERALDVVEGLPEYTAWKLTSGARAPALVAAMLADRDRSMGDTTGGSSVVRSFPYATGPAYGLLLDALEPGWRRQVRAAGAAADLEALLASAVGEAPPPVAADVARRYGAAVVEREERARWTRRERELADLRARFVDGPTIRIRPGVLNISFDPRAQASLGEAGTVMRGLTWRGSDGAALTAPAGALVTPDWHELRVPARGMTTGGPSAGPLTAPVHWEAAGWSLALPAGWVVKADGESWVVSPH